MAAIYEVNLKIAITFHSIVQNRRSSFNLWANADDTTLFLLTLSAYPLASSTHWCCPSIRSCRMRAVTSSRILLIRPCGPLPRPPALGRWRCFTLIGIRNIVTDERTPNSTISRRTPLVHTKIHTTTTRQLILLGN